MKFKSKLRLALLIAIGFTSIAPLFGQKALVIGIDGIRSDVFESSHTPVMDDLISDGLYSPDCLNDDITISGPGWSAILCGVRSDKHGVTGNDFSSNNYDDYPTVIKYIEEANPNLNTISICHWNPINDYIVQSYADTKENVGSDIDVETRARHYLDVEDPDLLFLHFDECDGAGHSTGFTSDSPDYVTAIETTDSLIGEVINSLKARPNYPDENWAVFITSDHGGIGFSHGGETIEERRIPFIIAGDSIETSVIIKDSSLLSITNCLMDTTELTFDGDNDYVEFPHIPDYDFGPNRDFTVECRVRTSMAADVAIIGNKDWDSGNNKGFVFSFKYPSGPEWKVNIGDGSNRADLNIGAAIADNEWHSLAVTFDRDGMMKMYQEGVFVGETSIASIGDIDNGSGFFLGTDINQAYDFGGSIAEVRIWDMALDASAISDYACNEVDAQHPNYNSLIGYWKLDDEQATVLEDFSTNDNDGIITDATWMAADSTYVYDYSETPKLVDLPVSVLGHLCIAADPSWDIDGQSWVADCTYDLSDCVNPGYITWNGSISNNWHDADNWDKGRVPLVCDNVIIPADFSVNIQAGATAVCYTLKTIGNAELCQDAGANFDVLTKD